MAKTTRRNLLKVAAAGGVSAALAVTAKMETRAQQSSDSEATHSHGYHANLTSGPLAQATVSFGQFPADFSVDRMRVANPGNLNSHFLIPNEVTIQAGGAVTFIIEGFHQVVIYQNGTQPGDINSDLVLGNLIDDPNGRIYRGLSPAGVPANFFEPGVPAAAIPAPPQDRIESVKFPDPGTYLVICAVRGHFLDGMYGFVMVLP